MIGNSSINIRKIIYLVYTKFNLVYAVLLNESDPSSSQNHTWKRT